MRRYKVRISISPCSNSRPSNSSAIRSYLHLHPLWLSAAYSLRSRLQILFTRPFTNTAYFLSGIFVTPGFSPLLYQPQPFES